MGIMDMFKSAVNGNAPQPQPQTPGVPPQGTTPQQTQPMPGNIPTTAATTGASSAVTAGNGVIPQSTTDIAAASPLDTFKDLWKNDPNGTNKDEPYFNVNIDALNQAASQQDFTSSITQEQLQSIASGGEDAIKAFAAALNSTARDVYAKSAYATTKIVEGALAKAEGKFQNNLPTLIKQHTLSDSLRSENPAFSHPAAQPIISALQSQLTMKFPQATESELRKMATEYLSSFASTVSPPKADATTQKPGAQEIDWSTFLS